MVIIVWLSLALMGIAFIWLIVHAVKESHNVKDQVIRLGKSIEILRKRSEAIVKQKDRLLKTADQIAGNFEQKKKEVMFLKAESLALVDTLRDSKEQFVKAYERLMRMSGSDIRR
jgi:uncharacterized protein YoxC